MALSSSDQQTLLNFISENKLAIKTHTRWENFSGNVKQAETLVLDIENSTALQLVLQKIYALNQTKPSLERIILRAAAGDPNKILGESYSLNDCAAADIIVRLVGKEFNEVHTTSQQNVMQVGGSLQIGELEELLSQHNLALPTSSLIPYVTVAGLSANAGHGTGKDQPSFAGLIKAITLCLPNGNIVRIDENDTDFETIRAAHLGLFGIVLNVEMECMPICKMQCVMEARSVPEFLAELKNGLFQNDPYISVIYVPTYLNNELNNTKFKNVLIYRWRPISKDANDVNVNPKWNHFTQKLQIKLAESFHLADLLRCVPSIIPYYMRYLVAKFVVGSKDQLSVGDWPLVHYQTFFPRKFVDFDWLFSVSKDTHEVADAFNKLVTQLNEATQKQQYPITYAAYLRLFRGTKGGLSTSETDKDYTCGFDIVTTAGLRGGELFNQTMSEYFLNQLNAKPHWGKYIPDYIDFKKIYGERYQHFSETLQHWYQKYDMELSSSMLLNHFSSKILGFPYLQSQVKLNDKKFDLPSYPPAVMAQNVLPLIEGKDVYSEQLRHQLRMIINTPKYKNTLFSSPTITTKSKMEQTDRKNERFKKAGISDI